MMKAYKALEDRALASMDLFKGTFCLDIPCLLTGVVSLVPTALPMTTLWSTMTTITQVHRQLLLNKH